VTVLALGMRKRTATAFYTPASGCAACCSITAPSPAAVRVLPSQPLRVSVDEPCCGIGGTRSAVRYLNSRKRLRPTGDDDFHVVSATDGDVRHAKTELYNATARRGEVLARSLRVESTAALTVARRIRPLLTVCGRPCWDLSVLGSGVRNSTDNAPHPSPAST